MVVVLWGWMVRRFGSWVKPRWIVWLLGWWWVQHIGSPVREVRMILSACIVSVRERIIHWPTVQIICLLVNLVCASKTARNTAGIAHRNIIN